jgi:5-methylcytosine-specific restriction endonuclease McrA
MCLRAGRMTKAEVADHIVPHKGNPSMFWSSKNMQSLCLQHGNGEKQRIENGRSEKLPIGVDGFPLEEGD